MRIVSEETNSILNKIMNHMFFLNSKADNIAYALESELKCPVTSDIYHEKVAHYFTGDDMADKLNEIMRISGCRPFRYALSANDKTYDNIVEAFKDNLDMILELKNMLASAIEELDYDVSNKQIVIELEDVLEDLMPYVHASDIWYDKAQEYYNKGKTYKFDTDFSKFLSL